MEYSTSSGRIFSRDAPRAANGRLRRNCNCKKSVEGGLAAALHFVGRTLLSVLSVAFDFGFRRGTFLLFVVPDPVKSKSSATSKIKISGGGQECPPRKWPVTQSILRLPCGPEKPHFVV